MRGWFPSNYVRIIEVEEEEEEAILEPQPPPPPMQAPPRKRNTEYRLSLLSNNTSNWILQRTEDGDDTYYYNIATGEMRIDPPNEEDEDDYRWSDQSTLASKDVTIFFVILKTCVN